MRSVTVTLAEREYTICELRSRQNEAWRAALKTRFESVAALIENTPATELTTAGVGGLIRNISNVVLGSIADVRELLFEYAPELAQDREYIEEEAYDSDLMNAFTEVLTLAFPFGSAFRRLGALIESGPQSKATSPK